MVGGDYALPGRIESGRRISLSANILISCLDLRSSGLKLMCDC